MKLLVCNVGSTSFKSKLYEMPQACVLSECRIESVGSPGKSVFHFMNRASGFEERLSCQDIPDCKAGIERYLERLHARDQGVLSDLSEIERVGFKTVLSKGHLGVHELTPAVMAGMVDWMSIARTHNEPYLLAVNTMRAFLPHARFIGCFETAFHRTIPLSRRIYGLPYEWYEQYGIQRLGYHGASHGYIADLLNAEAGQNYRVISCHLGGSGSVCAIENGKSIANSFGMSLQTGLIHASRTGDIDCDLADFLRNQGLDDAEIEAGYKRQGGLLGISGVSGDMREVLAAEANGNARAELAIEAFVEGIVHYIGAYYAQLGGLDWLVFTGGIGERSPEIRSRVCGRLPHLGIRISEQANRLCAGRATLSEEHSSVRIEVIPADEELGIARRTYHFDDQEVKDDKNVEGECVNV